MRNEQKVSINVPKSLIERCALVSFRLALPLDVVVEAAINGGLGELIHFYAVTTGVTDEELGAEIEQGSAGKSILDELRRLHMKERSGE
jgi:hypothetical protein